MNEDLAAPSGVRRAGRPWLAPPRPHAHTHGAGLWPTSVTWLATGLRTTTYQRAEECLGYTSRDASPSASSFARNIIITSVRAGARFTLKQQGGWAGLRRFGRAHLDGRTWVRRRAGSKSSCDAARGATHRVQAISNLLCWCSELLSGARNYSRSRCLDATSPTTQN